ncbi:MAG: hypothetical protein DRI61_01365 [Chloroflexi bacterium]|nr:MAG: hypothetical protein DRI61_01365 [Chloroflexota bacterium]
MKITITGVSINFETKEELVKFVQELDKVARKFNVAVAIVPLAQPQEDKKLQEATKKAAEKGGMVV